MAHRSDPNLTYQYPNKTEEGCRVRGIYLLTTLLLVQIFSDPATFLFFIWILICRDGVRTMCHTKSWRFSGTAEYRPSTACNDFQVEIVHVTPT